MDPKYPAIYEIQNRLAMIKDKVMEPDPDIISLIACLANELSETVDLVEDLTTTIIHL